MGWGLLVNRSAVQVGLVTRIVIAAKRLRSYKLFGRHRDTCSRSIGIVEESISQVPTRLWMVVNGASS